jgi:hypothetical protein
MTSSTVGGAVLLEGLLEGLLGRLTIMRSILPAKSV